MPQRSPRNHGCGRNLAYWLFSSSFLHKRTTFNVERRERRVTQFQADVFVFLFVKILRLTLLTIALREHTGWHSLLSAPMLAWDSLCHDVSRTKVLRPGFLIAPWSYIPCTSAFVPRPPHLEHFLSPALRTQTQDSSVLPLLQYSVQTPLSRGRSLWSAQLENASPLFELRRIAYGSYHCRLCIITLWTLSETTFNTLELETWIDFSLGFKIIVSSIMCLEWAKDSYDQQKLIFMWINSNGESK